MASRFSSTHMRRSAAAALLGAAAGFAAGPVLAQGSTFSIGVDEAKLLRLERPAADIIIGNPSIADVTVQSGKLLVVTGKTFGRTNLIVIDAQGKEVINTRLSVSWPGQDIVSLHKGNNRFSYYCAPNCETPLVVGDQADYFSRVQSQIESKQKLGESGASGSAGIQ